ncbi:MAG: dTDP-4-dehydrorhamnose 3,5-epimerase [Deltaproteobacteria bacterium]
MPFEFRKTEIPDVLVVAPAVFRDGRGFFAETYKRSEFAQNGILAAFVQDNLSRSKRGVIRGIHYQLRPKAQAKLVSVAEGEIWDVAVDIRRNSPTYGRWVGVRLTAGNNLMLYVPEGFAHGFAVLSEEARVIYKVSEEYCPEYERGIRWDDAAVGVEWAVQNPIISPKDSALPPLSGAENNF